MPGAARTERCSGVSSRAPGSTPPPPPPRLFLRASRFSDSLRRTARYLGPLSPVLVECRCLEVNGERGICFEPVEGDVEAAAPPEPIPPEPAEGPGGGARGRVKQLVSHLERLSFRGTFR